MPSEAVELFVASPGLAFVNPLESPFNATPLAKIPFDAILKLAPGKPSCMTLLL